MREVEHQSEQQNLRDEIPGEQSRDTRTYEPAQNHTARAGGPRLPRAWKITIAGGVALLVMAIIFGRVLSGNRLPSQAGSTPSSSSATGTGKAGLLPYPTSAPIQGRTWSDHTINFTIANGIAYAGATDNAVYALRASDGTVLWRQKIDGSVDVQPFTLNGVVYVDAIAGQNGPDRVYALRASDGGVLWSYTSRGYIYAAPSSAGTGLIYLASPEGISALRASNGSILWHAATTGGGDSRPVASGGVVYATSPGTLYALRASDGRLLWQYRAGSSLSVQLVSDGVVYISSDKAALTALRARDGYRLWQSNIDASFIMPPQLVDGTLYTAGTKITVPPAALSANPLQGDAALNSLLWNTFQASPAQPAGPDKMSQSALYAIRASDGTMLWRSPIGSGSSTWANWFSVERGVVYGASINATGGQINTGNIYAFQASNGALIWRDAVTQAQPSVALLNNGVIYLGTGVDSGISVLYALRTGDGSLLWNYPVAGTAVTTVTLDGSMLYISAANGMVYALQTSSGAIRWHYQTDVVP